MDKLVKKNLLNRLMTLESDFLKKFQEKASERIARQILLAPDHFTAAIMMKENDIFFGRGDFTKVLDILSQELSDDFKDVGNKLALIKTGYLYRKGIQPDINQSNSDGIIAHDSQFKKMPGDDDRMPLFSDKKNTADTWKHAINYKRVFKIWSKQIFERRQKIEDGECGQIQEM